MLLIQNIKETAIYKGSALLLTHSDFSLSSEEDRTINYEEHRETPYFSYIEYRNQKGDALSFNSSEQNPELYIECVVKGVKFKLDNIEQLDFILKAL